VTTTRLGTRVARTDAPSGVIILSETMPSVRSVAVGVWVRTASAHESPAQMGISHLLEHLVFKGTERRTAREIALALEARGGTLDAFTGRDQTSFQARVLDDDLSQATDILTDLVRRPLLRGHDLELERRVVLEEIAMVEDTPDDLVFDLHARALWPDHPYGFRILGTRETVTELRERDLKDLHGRAYRPANCVIAAAGHLDHERLVELLGAAEWLAAGERDTALSAPAVAPAVRGATVRHERALQQTHIVSGTDTVPYADSRRIPITLVASVLGGGMSSRLFQRVREELGVAYAVYTHQSFYLGTGVTGVYVATHPRTASVAMEAIGEELRRVAAEGVRGDELADAKQQLKGQLTLSNDNPAARMYRLAAAPLFEAPFRSLDEALADIDATTEDAVAHVAAEFFDPDRQTTVWLGPSEEVTGA